MAIDQKLMAFYNNLSEADIIAVRTLVIVTDLEEFDSSVKKRSSVRRSKNIEKWWCLAGGNLLGDIYLVLQAKYGPAVVLGTKYCN